MSTTNETAPTQATHTPGPWRIASPRFGLGDEEDRLIYATMPDGSRAHVAETFQHQSHTKKSADGSSIANARLIAAAPDLLAALIRLREWVRHPGKDDSPENESVIDQAESAIAKATA